MAFGLSHPVIHERPDTMSDKTPERPAVREGDPHPQYTPTGLNECLRIGSIGYVYEPELDAWTHDYRTPEGYFAQHTLTAEDIHAIIWAGRYRVTTWEVTS